MAMYPAVQAKAQVELDAVVDPDRLPTHSMSYMVQLSVMIILTVSLKVTEFRYRT